MFEEFFSKCKLYDEAKPSKKRVNKNIAAVRSLIETEGISMTETKRKKRIKPLIIAAAAAVVLLLAGFTTAVVSGKHVFSFNRGNSKEHAFDFVLESHELTIPEEFKPQNGEIWFNSNVNTPPREVFEKFGLKLPANDNFSDVADSETGVDVHDIGDSPEVHFRYCLYNKAVDYNVFFTATYFSNVEKMTYHAHTSLMPGEPNEVITLNNGASCMVSASMAVFSYDGAKWEFLLDYDDSMIPDNYGELTEDEQRKIIAEMIEAMPGIEAVKQVLRDMELL